MTDPIRPLGALLAVQLALGVATWWPSEAARVVPRPLVDGGAEAITALEIAGGADADPVRLSRDGETWRLDSAHGFPALADRIDPVVEGLSALTLGRPIATRSTSHESLGVTEDEARKRVTITTADGTTTTVLLSAAGRERAHLRTAGDDAVYAVDGLGVFTLRDTVKGYLPSRAFEVAADTLQQVTVTRPDGSLVFVRETDDRWGVEGQPDQVATDAFDDLLDGPLRPRLTKVLAAAPAPEHGLAGDGRARLAWSIEPGTTGDSLVVGAAVDGGVAVLPPEGDHVLVVPADAMAPLLDTPLADLVRPRRDDERPEEPADPTEE